MKKSIEEYRINAEEDYMTTPISVLRYITELEQNLEKEKIKSQIEIIRSVGDMGNRPDLYGILKTKLVKLNQQLKELEDEV
jgi:hypothetical protein